MSELSCKSTENISPTRLRRIKMILANRWLETWEIVEARNSLGKELLQHYDLWLNKIDI